MRREVLPARRIPRILQAAAFAIVCAVAMLASVRYFAAPPREVTIERYYQLAVPTLCEDRPGMWTRCWWIDREGGR